MTDNPFLSKIFTSIWLKHFNEGKDVYSFKFLENSQFFKHKYLPFYTNVGRNITNGMYYSVSNLKENTDYKNKVFFIHDVPTYFDINCNTDDSSLRIKKAQQYNGFLVNLSDYESFDDFFSSHYKSKTRYNLRKKQKSLNACFNVKHSIYYGDIKQEEYTELMADFGKLIGKRFGELGLENSVLSEWNYYKELFYEMVVNKQALILAMYRDDVLISGALCFLSDDIMFYAAPTFDADYYDFNLGHETITELCKWCFENNVNTLDFSKGEFDYKKRWANKEYDFECHVLYDSSSLKSKLLANSITNFYRFKQYLRDKKVNFLYSKLKHFFKGKSNKKQPLYVVEELKDDLDFEFIDSFLDDKFKFLRPQVFKYLFKRPELANNLKIYHDEDVYYVIGEKTKIKITTK